MINTITQTNEKETLESKAGKVIELNPANFAEFVKEGNAIVDFYADWCIPCKKSMPTYEQVSEEIEGVKFGRLNVEAGDTERRFAVDYRIWAVPTLILYQNGKEIYRHLEDSPNYRTDSHSDIKQNLSRIIQEKFGGAQ